MTDEKNVKLYARHKVYTEKELSSRCEIMLSEYVNVLNIEARTIIDLTGKQIIPACLEYTKELVELALAKDKLGIGAYATERKLINQISELTDKLQSAVDDLSVERKKIKKMDSAYEKACHVRDIILPKMQEIRSFIDKLEVVVAKKYWPFPTYGDLLFY